MKKLACICVAMLLLLGLFGCDKPEEGTTGTTDSCTSGTSNGGLTTAAKPIIYLYPDTEMECSVKLTLNGQLTCTYPIHGANGWQNFTTYPDGTLIFPDGKAYYALYWEGVQNTQWDFSKGWCVPGEDTAAFLDCALEQLGLNRREANEFIVYWLPLMEQNPYNIIQFQTDAYTQAAQLMIDPAPDTVIRVFMTWQVASEYKVIPPQELTAPQRQGFTVVEWGGAQIK